MPYTTPPSLTDDTPSSPNHTPSSPDHTPSSHWGGSLCCLSTVTEVVVAGPTWSTVHSTCEVLQCADSHKTVT